MSKDAIRRWDYHIHPTVIQKPEQLALFVEAALCKNIQEICITDHMPLSVSNASDRIPKGKIREYCRLVRELARKYDETICIKCGIEVDYHPSVIPEVQRVLEEGSFDYILASTHMHVFIQDYPRYSFNSFAAAAIENSLKAAETGWFDAIAHPDMYRFAFENPHRFPLKNDGYDLLQHEDLIQELLDLAEKQEMFLEINPHLAESKRDVSYTYPDQTIVQWGLDKNVRFSYGSDAHTPQSVGAYLDELERHPVYGKALEKWMNQK